MKNVSSGGRGPAPARRLAPAAADRAVEVGDRRQERKLGERGEELLPLRTELSMNSRRKERAMPSANPIPSPLRTICQGTGL
jgi:hypothetical protein